MVQCLAAFLDFCYIVRQSSLDEADLVALDEALLHFKEACSIFEEEDIRPDGISIPRIHALHHYHEAIELFGAPNGISTSIVESKHIQAVKRPYRRTNKNKELGQILLINQRQDKLSRFHAERYAEGKEIALDENDISLIVFILQGLLRTKPVVVSSEENEPLENTAENASFTDDTYLEEVQGVDDVEVDAVVSLAKRPCKSIRLFLHTYLKLSMIYFFFYYIAPRRLRNLSEMGKSVGHPELPDLVAIFLFQQRNPNVDIIPDISQCPKVIDPGYSFSSATATFRAPSDLSGANGMHCQHIHASPSWRNHLPRYDCVFVEKDPTLPGFQGLFVAKVLLFFSFDYRNVKYPCALVQWFTSIGDEPCKSTGMWKVQHEYDEYGNHLVGVIHLDSILRAAHLIPIYGEEFIPHDLHYSDSLSAFASFYVNKYSDYHAFQLAF